MAFSEASAEFQKCSEGGSKFPLILVPSGPAKDAESLANALQGEEQQRWFDSLLVKHGAVLLRGFEVWTPQQMDMVVSALNWKEYPYLDIAAGAVRTRVFGRILTVNENIPLHLPIGHHNEAAYAERTPTRLFFFCETPPAAGTGGASPIVLGNVVYKRVCENVELADKILGRVGVPAKKYNYDDKESAEADAKRFGVSVELRRLPDDRGFALPLRKFGPIPVFKEDRAGRMAMFSSLGVFAAMNKIKPEYVYLFEDGSEIGLEAMEELLQIMYQEEVFFPWQRGDILVLDNSAVLHSRQPCTSLDRGILVALVED